MSTSLSILASNLASSKTFVASSIVNPLTSGTFTLVLTFSAFSSSVYLGSTSKYFKVLLITSFIIGPAVVEPKAITPVGSSTMARTTI